MTPTYSVLAGDARFRALVAGAGFVPALDTSELLRAWDRSGFRVVSLALARHIGAAIVVLRDGAAEPDLLDELPAADRGE